MESSEPIEEILYERGKEYVLARLKNPKVAVSDFLTDVQDTEIGKLKLSEVVGSGHYGEVRQVCYKGRLFAVKTEKTSGILPDLYLEWFIRMYITLKRITPHIGRFEGVIFNRGSYQAVMDAHLFTLYSRRAYKPLGKKQKIRYFIQAMKTLQALHANDIKHHDCHASNWMFERRDDLLLRGVTHVRYPDGTVVKFDGNFLRLIDFGYASFGKNISATARYGKGDNFFVDVLMTVRAFRMSNLLSFLNDYIKKETMERNPLLTYEEMEKLPIEYDGSHLDMDWVNTNFEVLRTITPALLLEHPEVVEVLQRSAPTEESNVIDVWDVANSFQPTVCSP